MKHVSTFRPTLKWSKLRLSETKEFRNKRMAAKDTNDADKHSGYRNNERNEPNSTSEKARWHNCRERAKKKGRMNLQMDNSTRESGDGTTTGELKAMKIPQSVVSNADGLLYSDNDSVFVPIAASEQHVSGCRAQGLLETSGCKRQ